MKKFFWGIILSVILISNIIINSYAKIFEFNTEKEIPVLTLEDRFGMFEAEDMYIKGEFKVTEDSNASGGKYITPQNTASDLAGVQKETNGEDHAKLIIDVEEEANYTIWLRLYFLRNSTSGNFFINLDGNITQNQFDNGPGFVWSSALTTKLTKGKHSLGFLPRRNNMVIDKILITSSEIHIPTGEGQKPAEFIMGKEGENKSNLFFPLPSYTPPAEHPRLYIRNKDIPEIVKNLTHPQNIIAWEKVRELSESNLNCTVQSDVSYSYDENIHKYLEACAFRYVIDKKENLSYGKKAVEGLKNYLSSLSYSGDSLTFARSGIIQYIAKVYDWCYPLLTEEDKAFFIKKGLALATKLECGWPPVELSAFNSDHGGEGSIQVDMLSFATVTYEDYPDIWNSVAGRYFSEYVPINNFYYNQSWWQAEGDSYGKGRYGCEAKGNSIITKLGMGGLISPAEKYLPYNQIYRRRPDGNFMMDGDIFDITFTGNNYKGDAGALFFSGWRYGDPYIKYELYKMVENGLQDSAYNANCSLVDFLVLNDVNVGLKSNEELPLTAYTGEGHNMMTVRTGWDDGVDSNTMVVSLKGGGRTRGGHGHCDAGNFTIYYKGPLAIDSGVYNGQPFVDENGVTVTKVQAGSYHYSNYLARTIAHNCILVYDPNEKMTYHNFGELNDGGQLKETERVKATGQRTYEAATDDTKIIAERLGVDYGPDMSRPAYSYLKSDITNAYSFKVEEYNRTFMFHNLFDETYPGVLIVMDKVTSADPDFKKTWLLHSQQEPIVDGQLTTIKRNEYGYNGRLINEALLPKAEDSVTTKIGGPGKEYWVGDRNVTAVTGVLGDESGKWRVEISPKKAKNTDYFLNVLQVSDDNDNIPPLKSTLYESGDYAGVKIKDRVTYLTKNTKKTSSQVTVYAEGNEDNLIWTTDGLSCGKWDVIDENGEKITTVDVTEEGGVAYFEAKPGAYILKMKSSGKIPSKNFDILAAVTETKPLKYKLAVNTMYQYIDDEIKESEGKLYIPAELLLGAMDKKLEITDKGNKAEILFQDELYSFDLTSESVMKETPSTEEKTEISLSETLKRIDGKLYIPEKMVSELFKKTISTDNIGKIIRVTDNFKRESDYIINSIEKDRITVESTSDTDMALESKAYMALDGDISTSASINTIGGTMTFEFKEKEYLKKVSIAWNSPTERDYFYEFYVSYDGVNFEKIKEGQTGYTGNFADYEINAQNVKSFRVTAKGNTLNDWFVIKEIQFYNNK